MKTNRMRIVSVLLAVLLTFGVLPTAALAGPSVETIDFASICVSLPIAGNHPVMTGQTGDVDDPFTVDEVHFFELDYYGNPMGKFLDESYTFVANQEYACQVILTPDENYAFSQSITYCVINGYSATCDGIDSDGTAYFTTYLTAAEGAYTVTFDANGSSAAPPASLQVPYGCRVWDVIPNFDAVRMPDQPFEKFMDWSLDPFATSLNDFYDFSLAVNSDLTLYAIWSRCEKSVDLFVQLPADCLVNDVYRPTVTGPENASYYIETDRFYVGLVDGHPHYDLVYVGPLEKGQTYYSHVYLYGHFGAALPEINLYGAQLISAERFEDYGSDYTEIEVIFSVTPAAGDSLTKASVSINTPNAGDSATSAHPVVKSLTPGIEMSAWGWYTSPDLSGDWYEGTLVGGTTYYALVRINSNFNYDIDYSKLKLDVYGKNAKLVRMVDLATQEGVPNFVGAVVAVTIPRTFDFAAEVPFGGGRIRSDRDSDRWVSVMDFSGVEEGPITLEAKAESGRMFSMWYDGFTNEVLSRDPIYTFTLDRDRYIKASFVQETPFVDVLPKDYFYEPVLWAIEHDPVITSGVDETHFGPKRECTRAQIVTFLWKALYEPEYDPISNPFTDVKEGKYYYDAVLWAYSNGITSGVGGGKFGVNQGCTRAQAMFFLWKSYGAPAPESTSCPFTDVSPKKYYYDAILWAYENGVTGGLNPTTFGVDKTCTRAQIITFLYKVYGPKG